MRITRRHVLAADRRRHSVGPASAADTIRVGLPTKTYWPTTIAETAVRQKLFEKEGIKAELTIYRSGAETFEGMAAGAADIILDPPSLVVRRPQEGRDVESRRQCRDGQFRLAIDGARRNRRSTSRTSTARRSRSPRPAPAPTCWRCGPSRTRRSISPACPSAAAAWCRTCSPAMSTPPWSIRR